MYRIYVNIPFMIISRWHFDGVVELAKDGDRVHARLSEEYSASHRVEESGRQENGVVLHCSDDGANITVCSIYTFKVMLTLIIE